MESNEHEHEPSYYEVALTNRQVVIGFVALLACVFTAFLAGVWLGRDAAPEAGEQVAESPLRTVRTPVSPLLKSERSSSGMLEVSMSPRMVSSSSAGGDSGSREFIDSRRA